MELQDYEKDHLERVRALLPECTVLLKCAGDFPLAAPCDLALYGSGARHTVKGGTGSGEVNSRSSETIEEGLAAAGFRITSGAWLDAYDQRVVEAKAQFKKDVKALAREKHANALVIGMGMVMPEPEYTIAVDAPGSACVYVLSRKSGEGNDRKPEKGDLLLTETETRDILACVERYEHFMLVLNVGGPVDLSPVVDAVPNILVLSQLGTMCGTALADLLLGKTYPSGKLTTTWADVDETPELVTKYFGDPDDTPYREGVYVGYRYYTSMGEKPRFPFGYGLGYTAFEVEAAGAEIAGDEVRVRARVTNVGARPGKEVVQLYVQKPWGALDQPARELCAYGKTVELAPGATDELVLSFTLPQIASFAASDASYVLEAGSYVLHLGTSSAENAPVAAVDVPERLVVHRVRNSLGTVDFTDFVPPTPEPAELPAGLPVLHVDPAAAACEVADYDAAPLKVPERVKALSEDELVKLCLGAFDPKGGLASVIGSAATKVAGAAGQTAHVEGFPELVMADGPAGLRLSRDYFVDAMGAHGTGQSVPESFLDLLSPLAIWGMGLLTPKPKRGAEIKHQYATMIPIGTAIAQSWNLELARSCGDIVGAEMERFGVELWLAPALNIHRSVRCGRNFEYYSEDPLVSGRVAAAITQGVQAHPGRGTTIKHYAANNQETNRYQSNSQVSERAMREIYLRGFEICVRESQPAAVMSSYNLLNGEHTNERRDLSVDVLRREFGFEGILMTDWVVAGFTSKGAKYRTARADKVLASGHTLFMPGSKADYDCVKKALAAGELDRATLEQAATVLLERGKLLG